MTPKLTKTVSLPDDMLLGFFDDGTIKVCDELTLGEAIWRNGKDMTEVIASAPPQKTVTHLTWGVSGEPPVVKTIPLPDMMMLLVFGNGAIKLWDANEMRSHENHWEGTPLGELTEKLKSGDQETFSQVKIEKGGELLYWGVDEVDEISEDGYRYPHTCEGPDILQSYLYVRCPTVINRDPSVGDPIRTIRAMPVRELHIGESRLQDFMWTVGIKTVGDLLDIKTMPKVKRFGRKTWQRLTELRDEILKSLPDTEARQ